MPRYFACLLLILMGLGVQAHAQQTAPKTLNLLARSSAEAVKPPFSPAQRQWLRGRKHLLLGTSAPDNPPFDVASNSEYQGITAEYASLIGRALGVSVQVLRFTSRQEAVQALKSGRIDMLGSANGYEAAVADIALSRPYAVDQPVLVTREDDTRPLDTGLAGLRLSMLYHYLPLEEVRALYPQARLQTFASTSEALNAVAFGQADVFLGDTFSTHFQLHRGHLPSLRMANFGKHEATGFSFALRREDNVLMSLINVILDTQPANVASSIFKRWSAGSDLLLTDRRLQLTPREEHWLGEHPSMRVVVTDTSAPLSFFDSSGHFRGITADLLELIRLRTGLKFKIQRASGIGEMIEQVQAGNADLIAAITLGGADGTGLKPSRAYLESPYVIVTRSGRPFASLEQLKGRRVAVTRHTPAAAILAARHPQIRRIETESTFYSLALLSSGAVDATITTLLDANHAIAANSNLVIRASFGSEPASFSMASAKEQAVLASILDKALLSITPEELGVINSRWRGYALHDGGQWREYQRLVIQVVLGIGILLLMALAWNAYLRHQIGQRRQAERALNDQLEFMRALLNGTPHPMYVRDREGRLQSCNDSYLEAVDASAEEVMGKRLQESLFSNCDYTRQIHADYLQVMAAGTPLIIDRPLRLKDRELTIYHWILPYRDSLGEVQGIIGGWIDISERRELIQDLRLAKQQADDANRAKSTFLATISHEIRTPMNAVIGMLELAVKRADHGQLDKSSIEVAYHSAKDLLGLIGDILDIVRIESGHVSLAPEPVELAALIESVRRVFEGQAREKGLMLEMCIEPSARCHALLDPLRFKQILSNLVSNAIKFTHEGHVRIKASVQRGERPRLELEVRDSGIGIHDDDLRRLFNPFVQINPQSENARTGTGLGLAICRTLCDMMGGHLAIKSLQGVGTQVRLMMPLQCIEPFPVSIEQEPRLYTPNLHLRVLVIDDHPANLLLMAQQLAFLGLKPESARDGREGLEKWRTGHFDVLILDCNMPRMNGYQLAEAVRSEEHRQGLSPCTILGYTANAQPEVRQRCLDAGMDDCLLKPISLHTLSRHLCTVQPMRERPARTPFDLIGLDNLIGHRSEDRVRMLTTLQMSLADDLTLLMSLDAEHEQQAIIDQAHKILGVARMLDARALMNSCEALEEKGVSLSQLKLRRQALARHLRRVQRALSGQRERPIRTP